MPHLSTAAIVGDPPILPVQATRILILDDSETDRMRLRRCCESAGLHVEVTETDTLASFEVALADADFDLVFIDYMLVGETGLAAVDIYAALPLARRAPAIMLAGEGRIDIAVDAMRRGCADYVTKSELSVATLQKSIATAMERVLREAENRQGAEAARHAIGRIGEMRGILSATLRRVRNLRRHADGQDSFLQDLRQLEETVSRLWSAMPDLSEMPREALPRA